MSSMERDRVEHFRQRWAEENFNGSIVNPSSSSGASTGDQNLAEVATPPPANLKKLNSLYHKPPQKQKSSTSWRSSLGFGSRSQERLTEVAAPGPRRHKFQPRNSDEETALPTIPDYDTNLHNSPQKSNDPRPWVTDLYTISWLIFFSLLGTLSRLGVEAITQYPNAPVTSRVLWANIGGSFVMGFLSEDRMLFRRPQQANLKEKTFDEEAADHQKWKKTIPLYIGLTTGYCGSFTSFSSFIRDAFLELSNEMESPSPTQAFHPIASIASRNGGFSFLAVLAILIMHPAVSMVALQVGAQFALLTRPVIPNIHRRLVNRILSPIMVPLSIGCWLACSLILSVIPPYNDIEWRTRAMLPLMFAPIGCLLRYFLSKHLNALYSSFPLGTFVSNVFGTIVLGMSWDLQHADLAGLGVQSANACAILVGVQEGFCGCLTTVSTWVLELASLDRRSAWIYGITSTAVSLASLIIIMGSMAWTVGFGTPACN